MRLFIFFCHCIAAVVDASCMWSQEFLSSLHLFEFKNSFESKTRWFIHDWTLKGALDPLLDCQSIPQYHIYIYFFFFFYTTSNLKYKTCHQRDCLSESTIEQQFNNTLTRHQILTPATNSRLNEDTVGTVQQDTPYWLLFLLAGKQFLPNITPVSGIRHKFHNPHFVKNSV